MAWPWSSSSDSDDKGKDYISHRDGSITEIERKGNETNYYNYSKDDQYENDKKKGRDHGHVVIKPDNQGRERVAYVRNGHGDSRNFDKDWDKADSSSSNNSGGGCYIATASLQGAMPIEELEPLKEWRYAILEKSPFGNRLSIYYRTTAPAIAEEIAGMPKISAFLRHVIVKPAVRIAKRPRSLFNDVILFTLFVLGLSIAEIIKIAKR